jgi:phosphomannomutase
MCKTGKKLSDLVESRMALFPCSGEINRKVADANVVLDALQEKYKDGKQDFMDGISVAYDNWRFNVRKSNTEPVVRLNVETRGDKTLMEAKTKEILAIIGGQEA